MFFSISLPLFKNNFGKVTYSTVSTVCVTCVWAGVDNAWEQGKLEARKMLPNRADSHTSGTRGVGWLLIEQNRVQLLSVILCHNL
jgi:hypothetical protein